MILFNLYTVLITDYQYIFYLFINSFIRMSFLILVVVFLFCTFHVFCTTKT